MLTSYRFLDGATAASASATYLTDFRWQQHDVRSLTGRLDGGAQVTVTVYNSRTSSDIPVLVSTYSTSSFLLRLDYPVARIKVEKVGATGTAYVEGLV